MIVAPPRIVAVDNDACHLTALLKAFQRLGMPCLRIRRDRPRTPNWRAFERRFWTCTDELGVRTGSGAGAVRHYAVIAGLLQKCTKPTGGPFILVIWTQYPEQVDGLRKYPDKTQPSRASSAACGVGLSKHEFIDIDSGPDSGG